MVALVSKCGESHSEAVQLAVIRALLTITTAEHFVVHGDSLMQAVRTVFNVAIGSESVEIQRTARSALLQMLNTIVKRVTSYSLVSLCTAKSRHSHITVSIALSWILQPCIDLLHHRVIALLSALEHAEVFA